MPIIRKSLLQLIFSGTYMKRWNDKLRPVELLEVDKQAHKMMVAWLLFMLNSRDMKKKDQVTLGQDIMQDGLFDYFYRLVITDIKPPIFYKIKENPDHFAQLTSWVLQQLQPALQPLGNDFWELFSGHLTRPNEDSLSGQICAAAHLYASQWEFDLIKDLGPWNPDMKGIEESFIQGLSKYNHLKGVSELIEGPRNPLGLFAHLCGQLRFQKRWSQTPRIPETSVLGHLFIVAAYGYFFSLAVGACPLRCQNNFFTGIFHDLPEVLTRDIITPVKRAVQPMGDFIRQYEEQELESRVFLPLIKGGYADISKRLGYFLGVETGSEFHSAVILNNRVVSVEGHILHTEYNEDRFDPKDGELLKACDKLAAFVEAYTAQRNGISSDQLQQAILRTRSEYMDYSFGDLHVGALLADFD